METRLVSESADQASRRRAIAATRTSRVPPRREDEGARRVATCETGEVHVREGMQSSPVLKRVARPYYRSIRTPRNSRGTWRQSGMPTSRTLM